MKWTTEESWVETSVCIWLKSKKTRLQLPSNNQIKEYTNIVLESREDYFYPEYLDTLHYMSMSKNTHRGTHSILNSNDPSVLDLLYK